MNNDFSAMVAVIMIIILIVGVLRLGRVLFKK